MILYDIIHDIKPGVIFVPIIISSFVLFLFFKKESKNSIRELESKLDILSKKLEATEEEKAVSPIMSM